MNNYYGNKYLQFSFNNSNPNILNSNTQLKNFISEITPVIEEAQKIINSMKNELYIYQNLLTTERKFINGICISNLMNLEIFKDIDSKAKDFIKRMKEINRELNNFHNFKYNNKEEGYNNYDLEEKIDCNDFSQPVKIKNNRNIENQNNNIVFNNKREDITYDKCFKNPEKNLYQYYGIKLEDIGNRCDYIINKLINLSVNLEEYSNNELNIFLENVKSIGEESSKLSQELYLSLKYEFKKKYPNIIIDKSDKTKRALSSWFNQSLVIGRSNNKRLYFDYTCKKEI